MTAEGMRARTKQFTLRVLNLVAALPDNAPGRVISYQLTKSGGSVGANYRAVCRARSPKDFINKLGVVIEEADESAFWLEGNILDPRPVAPLLQEANELVAIFVAARKSTRASSKRPKPKG